jgi:hypothetical protein
MAERMSKDKSTQENRDYWSFVEETAREVAAWPKWMRGEREQTQSACAEGEKSSDNQRTAKSSS